MNHSREYLLREHCTKSVKMTCSLCGQTFFSEERPATGSFNGVHFQSIRAVTEHFKVRHPEVLDQIGKSGTST